MLSVSNSLSEIRHIKPALPFYLLYLYGRFYRTKRINEKREAEDKQFRLKKAEKAEQEKQQEEDKRLQKVMAERREMLDKMTWIERILESDIEKLAVFAVLYILFPGIFVCIVCISSYRGNTADGMGT
ncbi:hypothetical protein H109_04500 [Trichophyton interdigitale MR816]|uniref:Uncharacterized protein n=1 Tax=Trichophyton interdigitale (strain MR816) TaxID=1215338 RepID=A0A059J6Y8_TRIIM|nr:hypothetical protein H101_04115 [Trichophyton interdigitale H6]KDB23610.1 hypothetical protein H109_04500 [Trichophyton interdigitale MR816]